MTTLRREMTQDLQIAGLLDQIDPSVWHQDWAVHSQAVGDGRASLKYLAPYVFRVAISDRRIVSSDGGKVTFSYRKSGSRRQSQREAVDRVGPVDRHLALRSAISPPSPALADHASAEPFPYERAPAPHGLLERRIAVRHPLLCFPPLSARNRRGYERDLADAA
jgi:hypothetical protein